uniref:Uncharacterized protein n=1 Tax=Ditylenchus dipsaci TaxID=166011 RepID=A0A915E721_9BILA
MAAFEELAGHINTLLQSEGRSTVSVPKVALGFIQVANESTCRPIRTLTEKHVNAKEISFERILHMRYEKTDCVLMCTGKKGDKLENFKSSFMESYQREFGFTIPDRTIIIDDIRVRGIARRYLLKNKQVLEKADSNPTVKTVVKCWFEEGELDTSVYDSLDLHLGDQIEGPSIIIDKNWLVFNKDADVISISGPFLIKPRIRDPD